MEIEGIIQGIGPNKSIILFLKNNSGAYYRSEIPIAKAIQTKLDEAITWIGKRVKATVEKGEIESIELVE